MKCDTCGGPVVAQEVTYRILLDDKLIVVEDVPAKVCIQCGEKLYSAETVEHLQRTAWEQKSPSRVLETPVFPYPSS